MVCGLDVYHSGELISKTKPSIVGFVSSLDKNCSSYFSKVIKNKPGKELSDSNEYVQSIKESLEAYKKANNNYPKNIIFYRDGFYIY
jgi:hypothetical protein